MDPAVIAAIVSAVAAVAGVVVMIVDTRKKLHTADNAPKKIPPALDHETWANKGAIVSVKVGLLPAKVIGRDGLLDMLQRRLHEGGLVILIGAGGMGKSTIARELARRTETRRRSRNQSMHWEVPGRDRKSLITGLISVARDMGASEADLEIIATSKPSGPDRLWEHLEQGPGGWLLIIDNADDPELLAAPPVPGTDRPRLADGTGWVRTSTNGLVLVTSRDSGRGRLTDAWPAGATIYPVSELSDSDAAKILLGLAPNAGDLSQARTLGRRLGGLPLVLRLAGRYLGSEYGADHTSFDAFRQALERDPRVIRVLDRYPGNPERIKREMVMFTWELSLNTLRKRGLPQARPLLRLLSIYEPGLQIPVKLLEAKLLDPLVQSVDVPVQQVLEGLDSVGLIDSTSLGDTNALIVHPVIADTNRIHLFEPEASDPRPTLVGQTAVNLLSAILGSLTDDRPADWPTFRMLAPHLQALLAVYARLPNDEDKRELDGKHLDTLIRVTGRTAMAHGQMRLPKFGVELLISALALAEHDRDDLNPHILLARQQLAFLLSQHGLNADAESIYREILRVQLRIWPEDDPTNLVVRHNIAAAVGAQGRWAEAQAAFLDVLDDQQRVLLENHPDILATRQGLAILLCEQGSWVQAERELRDLLDDERQMLGENDLDTLSTRFNLAQAVRHQERHAEAEAAIRELLEDARRIPLSEDHFLVVTIREFQENEFLNTTRFSTPALREQTAQDLFNNAVALGEQPGSEQAAADAYQTVADRYSDDPSSRLRELGADALSNEAITLVKLERGEEALPLIEQAISIYDGLAAADPTAYQTALDSARELHTQIRWNIAVTLFNNAVALGEQPGSEQAAADAYQTVADRYSDDPSPRLRELADRALRNKAALRIIDGNG